MAVVAATPRTISDATDPSRLLKVNADGSINAGLVVESIEIGKVDQGTAGTSAWPVATAPNAGTVTDRSGTVTAGGTAQQAVAANAARKYLLIVNPVTATETLWFNFTTAAVADSPSIALAPGDVFSMPDGGFLSTEAISVVAATTGHKFTIKEA